MAVSVRKAFSNVFSQKYNKTNMIVYLALFIAIGIFGTYFMPQNNYTATQIPQFDPTIIFAIVCYFLFGVIATGMYDVAINNGYKKVEGVIPDIIENFGKIAIVGLKHMFGFFLSITILSIISVILLILPVIISSFVNNFFILGLLIVLLILIILVITSGIFLMFLKNFEFGTFFKFITAFKFICAKENVGKILIWGLKCLFFSLLSGSINFTIGFFMGFSSGIAPQALPFNHIITVVTIIGCLLGAVFSLFILDLTVQLLQELPERKEELNNEINDEMYE